ncbi:MAG: hypothetical protein KGD67_12945, partial [Candidatus Lokiarchaeota archaeon]|nr:hypothetical protein [Candidatus Lokiarchaeota archaeon]
TYTIDILPFTLPVDDGSVVNCPVDAQVAPIPPVMTDMCGTAIIPTVVVPPLGGCSGVGVDWVLKAKRIMKELHKCGYKAIHRPGFKNGWDLIGSFVKA